jgi:universal stress protein A
MKTILAPVDFSPVSRFVIDEAVALARVIGARVVLLHAVQLPGVVTDLGPLVGEALQFTAEAERGARRHLRGLQQRLSKRGVTVETICETGFPLPLVIQHAKRLAARYIVIGSHGHTAFYDLVIGSTTSGVLKRATCPVVVVPAQRKARKAVRARR